MIFSVKLHPKVQDFLEKRETGLAERIRNRLLLLQNNPFRILEHYEGDCYKLRVGDYRALVDVDIGRKIVFIRIIDHRSRIYKRR